MIVNPRGGTRHGLKVLDRVKPVLAAAGAVVEVRVTTHAGHAAELAGTLDFDGCDGFCLVGGDGTVHEALDGLLKRRVPVAVPVGIIPAGTGNDLARHFGCTDPVEAAHRIVAGATQPLDVARVRTDGGLVYCVNIIGWGAVVDVNRTAERLRVLGRSRYAVSALVHILRGRRRRATIGLDERVVQDDFLLAAACNTRFTGKAMDLAPGADSADGMLDVVLVRRATRRQMLMLFRRVFDGSHVRLPFVECRRVRSFRLESAPGDGLNLDGELQGHAPVAVDVIPAALRVFA